MVGRTQGNRLLVHKIVAVKVQVWTECCSHVCPMRGLKRYLLRCEELCCSWVMPYRCHCMGSSLRIECWRCIIMLCLLVVVWGGPIGAPVSPLVGRLSVCWSWGSVSSWWCLLLLNGCCRCGYGWWLRWSILSVRWVIVVGLRDVHWSITGKTLIFIVISW